MSSKTSLAQATTLVLRQDCKRPNILWPFKEMIWTGEDTVKALLTGLLEPVLFGQNPQVARSVSTIMQIPLVARLTVCMPVQKQKRDKKLEGKSDVPFNLDHLFYRDLRRCGYCGCETQRTNKPYLKTATFDHVHPRSRGGSNTWLNAVLSCAACNNYKGARTPEEAGMSLLIQPWEPTSGEIMKLRLHMQPLPVPEWNEFIPPLTTQRTAAALALAA